METIEEIKKYKDLYKKYNELVAKTTIRSYKVESGKRIHVQNISIEDLKERRRVEQELKSGLDFLNDNQLIDLSSDVVFAHEALDTLTKRKQAL